MAEDVSCVAVKSGWLYVKLLSNALCCTSTAVNKWMTAIKHQVAHVNNVCVFKMNKTITISMGGSPIMHGNAFVTYMFLPASYKFCRVIIVCRDSYCLWQLVFDSFLSFHAPLHAYQTFKSNISSAMIPMVMCIDQDILSVLRTFLCNSPIRCAAVSGNCESIRRSLFFREENQ